MDGWMVGWLAGWLDGWMDGWMNGWVDGLIDRRINGRLNDWTIWQMNRRVNGVKIASFLFFVSAFLHGVTW